MESDRCYSGLGLTRLAGPQESTAADITSAQTAAALARIEIASAAHQMKLFFINGVGLDMHKRYAGRKFD
jgi:hypothetical protein